MKVVRIREDGGPEARRYADVPGFGPAEAPAAHARLESGVAAGRVVPGIPG